MGWTLNKPWENGYTPVTEFTKGRMSPTRRARIWRKDANSVLNGFHLLTTRPDFNDWAAREATSVSNPGFFNSDVVGKVRLDLAPRSDWSVIWGSPWASDGGDGWFTNDSIWASAIRQLLPESEWELHFNNSYSVLVQKGVTQNRTSYKSVTRNGFTSNSYGSYLGSPCLGFWCFSDTVGPVYVPITPGA